MIENLIFDLGGVFIDIDRDEAVARFQALGLTSAETFLDPYEQRGIFLEVEDGRLTAATFHRALEALVGHPLEHGAVLHAWLGFVKSVNVELLRFIETLRSQYKVFLLSNTNPYIQEWADSSAFSTDGKPISHYFDRMYRSYEIGCTKPAPAIFEFLLRDSGIRPSASLFIDDGPANLAEGARHGLHTLHVESGEDWREKLTQALAPVHR